MKILFLGPNRPNIISFLKSFDDEVINIEENINNESHLSDMGFIISYGYRHIIKPEIINKFPHKIINLHISLLPWNRGADPNLWSFLEETSKGVTIHYIDQGIDTGDILAQKEIVFSEGDTLRTTYQILSNEIEELFKSVWPDIRNGNLKASPQIGNGSFHTVKDRDEYMSLLDQGWDTPVKNILGKAISILA
jgi:methionyl-tRNA formyltransferase